jgi:PII-like signaling protein
MALFQCEECGYMREVRGCYVGKSARCPQCERVAPIHDTVAFVAKLLKKLGVEHMQRSQLQHQTDANGELANAAPIFLEDLDIHNTTALTEKAYHEPIQKWLSARQIKAEVDSKAIDTTGFFDEVAFSLGEQYAVLQEIVDKIKRVQGKNYTNVKLTLSKKSQKDRQVIIRFCQLLYEYSFVAKYYYQKPEKIIRLTLQTASTIVRFFNGEWMEWFIFIAVLKKLSEMKLPATCLRSLTVTFANQDRHELDIFLLANNVPVCIECKSGEFRRDIDKYVGLRKRLNLTKDQFLICVLGLSQAQTQGLTSMYEVTFVNENNVFSQIESVLSHS